MADSCLGPSSTKPTTLSSQLSKYPWSCPPFSFSLLSPCNFSFTLKNPLFFSSYSSMSWSPNGPTIPNRFIAQNTLCSSYSSSPRNNQPSLLVFSGGTAFNGVVEELKKLTTCVAHVLPVSDDGGSTAEIVRVLGGPAVGDIRSRCLRLSDQSTSEALSVRMLLGHRLPLEAKVAKSEWYDIVEGNHPLWKGVSKPYRETIRAFLVYFQDQPIKNVTIPNKGNMHGKPSNWIPKIRAQALDDKSDKILRHADEQFSFSNGSTHFLLHVQGILEGHVDWDIGNSIAYIPTDSLVLPVISTNDRLTLGCELWDGTIIRGQNEISHPSKGSVQTIDKGSSSVPALPARIKRVFYMSSEGCNLLHEVFPSVNPTVFEKIQSVDCIVFAMGSLFTSICPSLVLRGIGEIISSRSCLKVLLLNGTPDRETSSFTASCFVTAITDALNRTYGDPENCLKNNPNQYINTILVPKDGQIPVDAEVLTAQGIFHVVTVDSTPDAKVGVIFDPESLIEALSNLLHAPIRIK